jgi:hypothetical protein
MDYPKVCIIILNWNGKELLKDCLSSLFKLTKYGNYKVIVVDNGSTDNSTEFIKQNFPNVDVLALDKNYGFPTGNNRGIRYALERYNPNYLILLNNDTKIIQKDWLTKMVEVAESDKKIGVVGCKLLYPNDEIQHAGVIFKNYAFRNRGQGEKDKGEYDIIEDTFFASGSCFLIKKTLIQEIGFLDEIYSPFLGEEMDYFFRARKAGFKVMYCGKSKIIHKGGISLHKIDNSKRSFIQTRNALILSFRYCSFSMKLLELLKSVKRNFLTPIIFIKALKTALIMYKYNLDKYEK